MSPLSEKKPLNGFIRYSSIGFQMGATLVIMGFIGNYADTKLQTDKPYLTLIFLLLGTFSSIYLLIKQLNQSK